MTEEEFVLQWLSRMSEAVNDGKGKAQERVEQLVEQAQSIYRAVKKMYNQQYCDKNDNN